MSDVSGFEHPVFAEFDGLASDGKYEPEEKACVLLHEAVCDVTRRVKQFGIDLRPARGAPELFDPPPRPRGGQ